MTDSNKVSFSIPIDPRDLGNVIGTENSIDPMRLTVLPDGFHPVSWVAADAMIAFARTRRAAREAGIADSSWTEHLDGDIRVGFPTLAERARAAALATARGATGAPCHRL